MKKAPFAFGVLILGAGASTRMGRCKLLLPWDDKTILTHLLDQWCHAGAAQIAPVIDPSNQLLQEALAHAGFSRSDWIENSSPHLGMFSSLQEGSRWTGWFPTLTHFAICLGDQPHIQMLTLGMLLDTARKNPMRICQPALHGRAGHPIVLPAPNFRELAQRNVANLRDYVRSHEALRLRMPVEDPGVSQDLNTSEDYMRWKPKEWDKSEQLQSIPVFPLSGTERERFVDNPFLSKRER